MRARSFRIRQQDGPAINLLVAGDGDLTFLLLHGFGDGGFMWSYFLPRLAPLGRAVAVDLRGHGDSDWDVHARYDSISHLNDMDYIVSALELKKIVLVGHSLGGEIAIRLAERHPERVAGLVIVDFGPELNRVATAHIRKEFVAESRVYAEQGEYAEQLAAKLPMIGLELRSTLATSALRQRAQGGYELKRDPAMAANEPVERDEPSQLWPILAGIQCPVLVVRGIASSVLPLSIATRMVALLPDGCLSSVKLAGHAVMIDNPEGFAAAMLSFIREKLLSKSSPAQRQE
jgi:3-oxoadipate enol-lactonase